MTLNTNATVRGLQINSNRAYQAAVGEIPKAPVPIRHSELQPDTVEMGGLCDDDDAGRVVDRLFANAGHTFGH